MIIFHYINTIKEHLLFAEYTLTNGNLKSAYTAMGYISNLLAQKEAFCGDWLKNESIDKIMTILTVKYMELCIKLQFHSAWTCLSFYEQSLANGNLINAFDAYETMKQLISELIRQENFAKKHNLEDFQLCGIQPYLNMSSQLISIVSYFQQLNMQASHHIDEIVPPTTRRRKSRRETETEIKSVEHLVDTEVSNSQRSLMASANHQLVRRLSYEIENNNNAGNQIIYSEVLNPQLEAYTTNQDVISQDLSNQSQSCAVSDSTIVTKTATQNGQNLNVTDQSNNQLSSNQPLKAQDSCRKEAYRNTNNRNDNQHLVNRTIKTTRANHNRNTQPANQQTFNQSSTNQPTKTHVSNQNNSNQLPNANPNSKKNRANQAPKNQNSNQKEVSRAPTPQTTNETNQTDQKGTSYGARSQRSNHLNPLHKANKVANNRYGKFHHPDKTPRSNDELANDMNNNTNNFQ